MKPHHRTSSVVIALMAALFAGCGGGSSPRTSANSSRSQPATAGGSTAIKVSDFKFAPASLTVTPGARVTVTNGDTTAHTATANDGHSFNTGTLAVGASKTISVSKAGTYAFHCDIHPFMHGTLVVK